MRFETFWVGNLGHENVGNASNGRQLLPPCSLLPAARDYVKYFWGGNNLVQCVRVCACVSVLSVDLKVCASDFPHTFEVCHAKQIVKHSAIERAARR